VVHGTALTLLNVTGLRLGEALRLTIADVDLSRGLLHVRLTKFGKSRLIPISADVIQRLRACGGSVEQRLGPRPGDARFFVGPTGKPVSKNALRDSFHAVLKRAGIAEHGGRRPRLHDLRGTFAVHRLLRWYEQNADLDAKLPLLVTYLGHVSLHSSQRYLQLARDLLGEVTRRHQACFGHLITDEHEGNTNENT
jgi:integrase